MAAIDKTYTDKWEDYKALVDWAKDKVFVCQNGTKFRPSEYIYDWLKEEDFTGREIPVMSTPQSLDYFLINNCPLEFVQDNLRAVYIDWYNEVKEGKSPEDKLRYIGGIPMGWETNRRIVWINKPKTNKIGPWVELEMRNPDVDITGASYDPNLKRFLHEDELGHHNIREWYIGGMTWKAVMRQIRKMPLPSMAYFVCWEGYINDLKKYSFFVI